MPYGPRLTNAICISTKSTQASAQAANGNAPNQSCYLLSMHKKTLPIPNGSARFQDLRWFSLTRRLGQSRLDVGVSVSGWRWRCIAAAFWSRSRCSFWSRSCFNSTGGYAARNERFAWSKVVALAAFNSNRSFATTARSWCRCSYFATTARSFDNRSCFAAGWLGCTSAAALAITKLAEQAAMLLVTTSWLRAASWFWSTNGGWLTANWSWSWSWSWLAADRSRCWFAANRFSSTARSCVLGLQACEQSTATAFFNSTTAARRLSASTATLFGVQSAEKSTAMVSCFSGFAHDYCCTDQQCECGNAAHHSPIHKDLPSVRSLVRSEFAHQNLSRP
ncbi:hypothetical protein RMSM_01460 [Rhodopirellula maiorica SM1]|uniref:Uncharacterized protein n=1 Tax=Rhodopirellula maiorica SM1 TaxID=1265738 RepID=M5S1T8_9BACT|nr:hypothetical protein RMSM_01460 [Rhodopirellula maiorica SM1]